MSAHTILVANPPEAVTDAVMAITIDYRHGTMTLATLSPDMAEVSSRGRYLISSQDLSGVIFARPLTEATASGAHGIPEATAAYDEMFGDGSSAADAEPDATSTAEADTNTANDTPPQQPESLEHTRYVSGVPDVVVGEQWNNKKRGTLEVKAITQHPGGWPEATMIDSNGKEHKIMINNAFKRYWAQVRSKARWTRDDSKTD